MRRALVTVVVLAAAACGHAPPAQRLRGKVEFTPVPELEAAHAANPHDHGGRALCQRCHVPGEERPAIDPITLCSQCHDASRMKHPWRVAQRGGAGPLPLMEHEEIACHTCHDPHNVKKHPHGLRDTYTKLCLNCHPRH